MRQMVPWWSQIQLAQSTNDSANIRIYRQSDHRQPLLAQRRASHPIQPTCTNIAKQFRFPDVRNCYTILTSGATHGNLAREHSATRSIPS